MIQKLVVPLAVLAAILIAPMHSHAEYPFKFRDVGRETGLLPAAAGIAGHGLDGEISMATAGPIYMWGPSAGIRMDRSPISCFAMCRGSSNSTSSRSYAC